MRLGGGTHDARYSATLGMKVEGPVIPRDIRYVLSGLLFNSNNLAESAALAEVCVPPSAILIVIELV